MACHFLSTSRSEEGPTSRAIGGLVATAWRAVLAVAGTLLALLLATAGRYGYPCCELYFLVAGRHRQMKVGEA